MSITSWLETTNSISAYEEYEVELTSESMGTDEFNFTIFANTECSHCIQEVAKILKILDKFGIAESNIELYNVNDDFEETGGNHKRFSIYSVPTLFIEKNGKLIGKSEGPIFSWEKDIIKYCKE
jgi:hypothetical protein